MKSNPKYDTGDYLIIYCGQDEGCCFTVKARRWTDGNQWQKAGWEYDTGSYGWRPENTISTEGWARVFS